MEGERTVLDTALFGRQFGFWFPKVNRTDSSQQHQDFSTPRPSEHTQGGFRSGGFSLFINMVIMVNISSISRGAETLGDGIKQSKALTCIM